MNRLDREEEDMKDLAVVVTVDSDHLVMALDHSALAVADLDHSEDFGTISDKLDFVYGIKQLIAQNKSLNENR